MALRMIEEAQNLINAAAQELCDVRGMCPEWEASSRLHDQVNKYWYRVKNKFTKLRQKGPLKLGDSDPETIHTWELH